MSDGLSPAGRPAPPQPDNERRIEWDVATAVSHACNIATSTAGPEDVVINIGVANTGHATPGRDVGGVDQALLAAAADRTGTARHAARGDCEYRCGPAARDVSEIPVAPLAASSRPGYLVVDDFLRGFVEARVLKTAFEVGLIDRLLEHGSGAVAALAPVVGLDQAGLRFLLDLLAAAGVTQEARGDVRLTRRFQEALRYRDLLEVKLDYAGFTINDFADLFTPLVQTPAGFTSKARLFELFDYRRALDPSFENYSRTRMWVRLTSTLTRYEAAPCLDCMTWAGTAGCWTWAATAGSSRCRRAGAIRRCGLACSICR